MRAAGPGRAGRAGRRRRRRRRWCPGAVRHVPPDRHPRYPQGSPRLRSAVPAAPHDSRPRLRRVPASRAGGGRSAFLRGSGRGAGAGGRSGRLAGRSRRGFSHCCALCLLPEEPVLCAAGWRGGERAGELLLVSSPAATAPRARTHSSVPSQAQHAGFIGPAKRARPPRRGREPARGKCSLQSPMNGRHGPAWVQIVPPVQVSLRQRSQRPAGGCRLLGVAAPSLGWVGQRGICRGPLLVPVEREPWGGAGALAYESPL